jgi:predicted amidohydrolase
MTITVSVVQIEPVLGDKQRNLSKIEQYIREAAKQAKNPDLIVLPELINTGYECGELFYDLAETFPDGESTQLVGKLAKEYKSHIMFGFAEEDSLKRGVLYNSVALVDHSGKPLGVYRKVHLFGGEMVYFRPGSEYPLFHTAIGKIGIFICWDTLFPEVARIYALQGADLLAIATNWEKPFAKEWDFMTSARAFDNTLHLAAANRIGHDRTLGFFGHSRILDPLGSVICSIDEEIESVASARIDLDRTRKLRAEYWTQLRDRRPDTYGALARPYGLPCNDTGP